MRMLLHLWMVLTLVLGICGDDMVKRAAEEGSGNLQGSGGIPITAGIDDEDYSSSFVSMSVSESDYEGGSGTESFESSESSFQSESTSPEGPIDNNAIRFRGEFTITGIYGGDLSWMPALGDALSKTYKEFSNLISPLIQAALQAKKATRKGLQSVTITGFRHGSIIVEYEASYSQDSTVALDQVRKSLKDAISNNNFGKLMIDAKSVSHVTEIRPQPVVVTEPTEPTPTKPVITTTQSNAINEQTPKDNGNPSGGGNEVDPITIDDGPQDGGGEGEPGNEPDNDIDNTIDNEVGNGMGRKTEPQPEATNFWDKLFSHPLILAGLVGAVVLALLTVVLLLMFIVYRIKKKDEGSYSLDEPHKVKDPMAYWKDTKEFYA